MSLDYTIYFVALIASTAITGALAIYVWRHFKVPATRGFTVAMLMGAGWSLTTILEMISPGLPGKILWANVQNFCYAGLPLMTLITVLQYTGRDRWLTWRRTIGLSIIPFATMLLVWTNDFHGLMRVRDRITIADSFPLIVEVPGPWFWVQVSYSGLLLMISLFILTQAAINAPRAYRGQPLVVLVGLFFPSFVRVLYVRGYTPVAGVDITPFTLSIAGAVIAWGLFRFRLLDIVPIARDLVFEGMSDGVIVLDSRLQVVDLNPSAMRILGLSSETMFGLDMTQLFHRWPQLIELIRGSTAGRIEFEIGAGADIRYFELHTSPLLDRLHQPGGQVIVLHDVSDRKQQEDRLAFMATHDLLTGLPNRRTLEDALQRAVARALRGTESALLFVDLDNFKLVNDTLGHHTGDQALVAVGSALLSQLRAEDLLIRLGGDEFAVLLEGQSNEEAQVVACRLKEAIEGLNFAPDGMPFKLSLSIGMAVVDGLMPPALLLSQADTAMYEAKMQGRNRVVVYELRPATDTPRLTEEIL